jgi:thiol-disulfide isomerase/thioredoxin
MKIKFSNFSTIALIALAAFFIGKYIYMLPKYSDGQLAPDFSATTSNGLPFQLSAHKGEYVLLDFWGSWCGPCLAENPGISALHKKYKGQAFRDGSQFTVVGIAIERDPHRWKRAMQNGKLTWDYHIMDATESFRFFNSPIAQKYGIKQVPSKYLVNPEGYIELVNPSLEALDQFLASKLP